MMRSLYSGVSGLQNHQTRMDVLGNNIANINTTGFKKGRVTFQDMLSQTIAGAARPTEEVGGVNPKQVGLGMNVAAIDTIHTQGSLQTTGNLNDLAIQGNGFFILSAGDKEYYTRAGAFGLDEAGTLVNPANGMKVMGWSAQTVAGQTSINAAADVGELIIPVGSKDLAAATTDVDLACNLDKRTPQIAPGAGPDDIRQGTWAPTYNIYDTFGNLHLLEIEFTKVPGVANLWQAVVAVDANAETPTNTLIEIGAVNNTDNAFYVSFDNQGTLLSAQDTLDPGADIVTAGKLQVQITFDVPDSQPATTQTFNLNLGEVGSTVETVTQSAATSSTKAIRQNGYTLGYLETYKIDQSGVITGVFSNGQNRLLGQVALASFVNPGGLEKAGENSYMVSNNSGDANIGPSGIAGKGKVIAGALEMSNVDLAEQFTDLIITQRGFQANSRSITTSDQMLQELLTLKR